MKSACFAIFCLHFGEIVAKSAFTIFLFILALSIESFAQGRNGFATVSFGANRQTLTEELLKLGYEPNGQSSHGNMYLSSYQFGKMQVQIEFLFNQNDKFYAFEIHSDQKKLDSLPKVFEDIAYISKQFDRKYRMHASDATLEIKDLNEGKNFYQQWLNIRALDINTYIVKAGKRYHAIGVVTHRDLEKEKRIEDEQDTIPVF